ncbi:uncharacterized protein LOC128389373 [Panonychus citri]|uniref:uncharacterized protein LOC128389373 n=1 Tax=Panonychus citri TaxID=50023 RepID=UPI0023079E13|nr:uncharacterized protein LOC128389373 [Panonychus citri]XP_053204928.1 uncharacterized protein LOC128389373 [Panonychus citri]
MISLINKLKIKFPISIESTKLLLLFCFIGCCLQLTIVTREFLKFSVRYEVTYDYPEEIVIPEIDIAIPLGNLITNLSLVYEKYPEALVKICSNRVGKTNLTIKSFKDFNQNCNFARKGHTLSYELSSIFTIGDIESFTQDPRPLILSLRDEHGDNMLDKCNIERFFNGFMIFLRVSCRDNNSMPITKMVSRSFMGDYCFIGLAHRIYQASGFRFAVANSSIENQLVKYFTYSYKSGESLFFDARYRRFITTSLSWPFETSCRDYNRSKILVQCMNDQLLNSSGTPMIFINSISAFGQYHKDLMFASEENYNQTKFLDIFNGCLDQVKQHECHFSYYHTDASTYSEPSDSEIIDICMAPPQESDTVYKAYPMQSAVSYLVYISSSLSLWFGFQSLEVPVHVQSTLSLEESRNRHKFPGGQSILK